MGSIWQLRLSASTGKTGNLVLIFSRQGKDRAFCCNIGNSLETHGKYFDKNYVLIFIKNLALFYSALYSQIYFNLLPLVICTIFICVFTRLSMFAWLSTFSVSKVLEKFTVSADQIIQALTISLSASLYNKSVDISWWDP